jgi:hypothetical protein
MLQRGEKMKGRLTDFELQQVHSMIKRFKTHVGFENAITIEDIEMHYRNLAIRLPRNRLNAIIQHIRYNESIKIGTRTYFLISRSGRFWISCDKAEISDFLSSLESRLQEVIQLRNSVLTYLDTPSQGQQVTQTQELF